MHITLEPTILRLNEDHMRFAQLRVSFVASNCAESERPGREKIMNTATKIIRQIPWGQGVLMDQFGCTAEIRFNLTETQDFVDEVPGVRRAFGTLKFDDTEKGRSMYQELENKTLIGGGIHAEVCVVTTESFTVTGSVMVL